MLSQQRYEELHALWASQDTRKPKTAIHYQQEAALYELERNLILALDFYRKAHLLAPKDAYIALDLARAHGLISHVRETKFWYQRALELDPNILEKVVLARSIGFLGREHELNFFNKFLKSKETHQLACLIKAEHLLALRREAEAILELKELTNDQWVKKASLIRGLAHFFLEQFDVAKKLFAECPSLTENPFIDKLLNRESFLEFG
ncbi:MAG: hypothetical protein ACE5R6_20005, partial [Candidatus Heimdallarchaeota archaeon]